MDGWMDGLFLKGDSDGLRCERRRGLESFDYYLMIRKAPEGTHQVNFLPRKNVQLATALGIKRLCK